MLLLVVVVVVPLEQSLTTHCVCVREPVISAEENNHKVIILIRGLVLAARARD